MKIRENTTVESQSFSYLHGINSDLCQVSLSNTFGKYLAILLLLWTALAKSLWCTSRGKWMQWFVIWWPDQAVFLSGLERCSIQRLPFSDCVKACEGQTQFWPGNGSSRTPDLKIEWTVARLQPTKSPFLIVSKGVEIVPENPSSATLPSTRQMYS